MSEPIEIQVVRFVCPHCHRGHSKRAPCVGHIGRCFSNPEVRACKTCVHFNKGHRGDGTFDNPPEPESCGEGVHNRIPQGCKYWSTA